MTTNANVNAETPKAIGQSKSEDREGQRSEDEERPRREKREAFRRREGETAEKSNLQASGTARTWSIEGKTKV